MKLRPFFVDLFLACLLVQVSRCLSEDLNLATVDGDADVDTSAPFVNGRRHWVLNEDADNAKHFGYGRKLLAVSSLKPSEVETVCVFPKNNGRLFVAGKVSELLVGLKNNGESKLVIIAIICSIHFRTDHERIVQKLMPQTFVNLGVPPSTTGTIPYVVVISKDLQVGKYNLVGTIYYILEHQPSQSIFYNGTIEIVEIHGIIRVRTVILITLIFSFIFCLWRGCVLLFRERSDKKKAKKAQEEAEWRELLAPQKTAAVTESSSKKKNKSKKKKYTGTISHMNSTT